MTTLGMTHFVALLAALLGGCGPWLENHGSGHAPSSDEGVVDCNPLAPPGECLLPFPSDAFRSADGTTSSGWRVHVPRRALPRLDDASGGVNPGATHRADGFSHLSPILALFPSGIDDGPLVFHNEDVYESLRTSSPTLLLRADTGEAVLHFAEVDPRAHDDARRALVIRPLVRLRNSTRYVVAIHDLTQPDGSPLQPPETFRRLRDAEALSESSLRALAEHYESSIFPVLAASGVPREEVQLAWDFTTQSAENVTADMLAARRVVLDALAAHPPEVTVEQVRDELGAHLFRRIDGTVEVPHIMAAEGPGARLHRDATGTVAARGRVQVPFVLLIPRSVASRQPEDPPARLVQYGHGFFGDREEVLARVPFWDALGLVAVAIDWSGMTFDDSLAVVDTIVRQSEDVLRFTDRVHQAMASFIALIDAARGPLLAHDALAVGPSPLYDPRDIYFYGLSQGAILGGTYAALSPHIRRFALGVGGAGLSFAMFRSRAFSTFLSFIEMTVSEPLEVQKYAALTQTVFDRIDPVTYAPHVLQDAVTGSPTDKHVLMQVGIGDAQFPNLASHLHARIMGVPSLEPAPRPIAALPTVPAPHDGSALTEFDFGVDPIPDIQAVPPTKPNAAHEGVRRLSVVYRQLDAFFRPGGLIESFCDGVCDPE